MDNKNDMIKILKEEFPDKGLDPSNTENINFNGWKLCDLKKFLEIVGEKKGTSKDRKEQIILKVMKVWKNLLESRTSYFDENSATDDELLSISSPLTTATPLSPLSLPVSPLSSPLSPTCSTVEKYPKLTANMTQNDFKQWTIHQLQEFLVDRSINKSGNKAKLVENAYGAYCLNLPISFTSPEEELNDIKKDKNKKLVLENGMLTLPDPNNLTDGWVEAPSNLPDTLYSNVNDYLNKNNAGKAFQGGKSLLLSGHLHNIMVHTLTPNVRFCFARALCYPEQRLSKPPYHVWVCLNKDIGEIVTGDCSCVAGVAGMCKHVGALLWYVEEQVRHGNNKTCTSKKQKWSVPTKKQQSLHSPDTLNNIEIVKPKASRILSPPPSKKRKMQDPRHIDDQKLQPLTETEVGILAEITNGNCGIVSLLRNRTTDHTTENFCNPSEFITVTTEPHQEMPPTLAEYAMNNETFNEYLNKVKLSVAEINLIQEATSKQADSDAWFKYRMYRITASKFKDAVVKVNDDLTIKNPSKSRTLISKVCGYYPKFTSKATEWGITNEPLARKMYVAKNKSFHRNFVVIEPGFYIQPGHQFIGASPDGLVDCKCHEPGLLEIKCPWSMRNFLVEDMAKQPESFLQTDDTGKITLKRNHSYFYQVQCQMFCSNRKWCDFLVCTSKDYFVETIRFDEEFVNMAVKKAKVAYKELIFPEIKFGTLKKDLDDEKIIKELVNNMICDVCDTVNQEDSSFDFLVDFNWEMSL